MEIIIGKTAGFCFGVKNAVDNTIEELNKGEKVYCLGELVHNKQVTEELISKGVIFIDNIEDAQHKAIIRAHGVQESVYKKANDLHIELKDLTCPKVLAIHKLAIKYSSENCYIFLVGQKTHPETIGTISFCGKDSSIVENTDDVEREIEKFKKTNLKNAVVLAQTTINLEKFDSIVEELKKYIENIEIKNTICASTRLRQEETQEIAKKVECMIIVGGKHSSNSNKLYEIAKKNCN
ncbi:MAG: 4-hydroxy-3-methylbut-2-enyl diphosphate reductase, partial [Clostridia bacterium]